MKNHSLVLGVLLVSMAWTFQVQANDEVVAKTKHYLVIIRTDRDTGSGYIFKREAFGKRTLVGVNENIYSEIQKLLPREEAYPLIQQMVDSNIKEDGGIKKCQENIDALIQRWGKDYFNDYPSLVIEAYKARGIIIPTTKSE